MSTTRIDFLHGPNRRDALDQDKILDGHVNPPSMVYDADGNLLVRTVSQDPAWMPHRLSYSENPALIRIFDLRGHHLRTIPAP